MGALIIGFALVALLLTGVAYYIVLPAAFNMKGTFDDKVVDAQSVAFGDMLYEIIGIFPLLFVGAIFLNAYQKSTRNQSLSAFG